MVNKTPSLNPPSPPYRVSAGTLQVILSLRCAIVGIKHVITVLKGLKSNLTSAHLFEDQRALPRSDRLRQLRDASLVEVRPREAAVVHEDLGAAVSSVGRACDGEGEEI